jgi:hypothetical protein
MNEVNQTELYAVAKEIFEENFTIRDLMKALPLDVEVAVKLGERLDCTLKIVNEDGMDRVRLLEIPAKNADLEAHIGFETLRMWQKSPPNEVSQFLLGFMREASLGHSKLKLLKSVGSLKERGYLKIVENLAPKVQAELMMRGMTVLGAVHTQFNAVKEKVEPILKTALFVAQSYLKKPDKKE